MPQLPSALREELGIKKENEADDYDEKDVMAGLRNLRHTLICEKPKRQQLFYIYHLILNRRKFIYDKCNSASYFFCRFGCMRSESSLKNLKTGKQDFLLNKGTRKLKRDLDILELFKIVRGFRVMKKTLFTKEWRELLQYSRASIIH